MPSISRDENRVPIQSNEAFIASKAITFDGTANKGAVETINLFTVTGPVVFWIVSHCTSTLISAGGGTIHVGYTGAVNALGSTIVASTFITNDFWTPDRSSGSVQIGTRGDSLQSLGGQFEFYVSQNITQSVNTATITGGTLTYYMHWRPLSSSASVVAA